MRIFKIKGARHKDKQIEVTKYIKHASGLQIEIKHNVPATTGKDLQWVQTFNSNNIFSKECKMNPIVDPFGFGDPNIHKVSLPGLAGKCKADDLKPFYFTDAEIAAGHGAVLTDRPSNPAPASGRVWTQFITALTEVTGTNVHYLVAIAWGYDVLAKGTVLAAVIRTPSNDEMKEHGRAMKRMYPSFTYT